MNKEKLKEAAIKFINEATPSDSDDWLNVVVDFAYEQTGKMIIDRAVGHIIDFVVIQCKLRPEDFNIAIGAKDITSLPDYNGELACSTHYPMARFGYEIIKELIKTGFQHTNPETPDAEWYVIYATKKQ